MGLLSFLPFIGSAASSLWNAQSQKQINQENVDWARESMNTQRSWALEDWNRQNEYNSPAAQMERFKAAGLNPNLIYAQTNTSGPIRSSDIPTPQRTAPQLDFGTMLSGIMAAVEIPATQAKTDLVNAQRKLVEAQLPLVGAKVGDTAAAADLKRQQIANLVWQLGHGQSLEPYQLEVMKANTRKLMTSSLLDESNVGKNATMIDKMKSDINVNNAKIPNIKADTRLKGVQAMFQKDENSRRAVLTSSNLQEAAARMVTMAMGRTKSAMEQLVLEEKRKEIMANNALKQIKINRADWENTVDDINKLLSGAKSILPRK